jgi:F0F1-type ATP synthase membrane subunit a
MTKKIIKLTEADLTKLVGRVIKEQQQVKRQSTAKRFITEAMAEAQMAIDDAEERIANGEKPDPKLMSQIKQCITTKQLTSLMFFTTGAGAYFLGILAMLMSSGVGMLPGGVLAIAGTIVLFISSISEKDGGLGGNPAKDVKALLSCINL